MNFILIQNRVWGTVKQEETLIELEALHRGGIGSVHRYIPTTDYVKSPVVNINFISRFSTLRLYERKLEALSNIKFVDIQNTIKDDPKVKVLSESAQQTAFVERKNKMMESLEKTLNGERGDARREGHDRCYMAFTQGVKVHLLTEKVNGLMQPILKDGYPIIDSIMISILELNRTEIEKGVRKVVNSGVPVIIGNAIDKCLNSKSVGFKTLSLKEDNFSKLVIQKRTFLPEEIQIPLDVLEL